jgi:hypothetical protein
MGAGAIRGGQERRAGFRGRPRRGCGSPSIARSWPQNGRLDTERSIKLAKKGGDAALDVAKTEVTAELTRLVSQFLGLA